MPIARQILVIRDKQVMLDRDLATLYGVETKRINEAVRRNPRKFPERFCFQLKNDEFSVLRSQFATSKKSENLKSQIVTSSWGGVRKMPFAFTEQGIAMLASVLHSDTAITATIQIMDAFVEMRHILLRNGGLVNRLSNVESKMLKRGEGVSATIYTYDKSKVFEVDLATYNAQYPDCPLNVLPCYGMHDRFLFIDDTAYHFGASLKDLGKNTFFFTQEDFSLEEVLKESRKIQEALEKQSTP